MDCGTGHTSPVLSTVPTPSPATPTCRKCSIPPRDSARPGCCRGRRRNSLDADPELGSKWRTVNRDPEFISWLNQTDDFAGAPKLQLLTRAFNAGDGARCGLFFKAFIASKIPARERTSERLPHEGTGPRPSVRAADITRGKVWSAKEIHNFYDDCRRGRYDEREAERQQIEAEILAAARQGRMAPDAIQPRDSKGPLF
jgi:hypothetical protein